MNYIYVLRQNHLLCLARLNRWREFHARRRIGRLRDRGLLVRRYLNRWRRSNGWGRRSGDELLGRRWGRALTLYIDYPGLWGLNEPRHPEHADVQADNHCDSGKGEIDDIGQFHC